MVEELLCHLSSASINVNLMINWFTKPPGNSFS